MVKRLFMGIELEEGIKDKIYGIYDSFKETDAKIKFVEKENLHITIKFLGDIYENTINNLINKLDKIKLNPFSCNIRGLGVFPNLNKIRVVWVGIDNRDRFMELNKKIEDALELKKEKNFHHHITIGRVKFVNDKERLVKIITKAKEGGFGSTTIEKFVLFESTLTISGPIYNKIKEFKLK